MKRSLVPGVVFVVACGALAAAQAKRSATAGPDFKAMVDEYWTAWASGGPDKAAPLYAKDQDLVFYDLEPLKYTGWDQYKQGVVPNILSKFARG